MLSLILILVALAVIGLRGWLGWRFGATSEMRYVLASLFAVLVAQRYWYRASIAASDIVKIDPQFVAAAMFVVIFLIAWMVGALAVNLRGEIYQSVTPNPSENVLGAICGLISGALLGGSLLLVASTAMAGKIEYPVALEKVPVGVFRITEQAVAGIPTGSLAHTLFPSFEPIEGDADGKMNVVWK